MVYVDLINTLFLLGVINFFLAAVLVVIITLLDLEVRPGIVWSNRCRLLLNITFISLKVVIGTFFIFVTPRIH